MGNKYTARQLPALTPQWQGSSQDNRKLCRVDRLVVEMGRSRPFPGLVHYLLQSQVEKSSGWSRGPETLSSVPPATEVSTPWGWWSAAPGLGKGLGREMQKRLLFSAAHRAGAQQPPLLQERKPEIGSLV